MNDEALIGRQVASYRIERFLGKGGMAEVYYAWDESLARPVAVKVIGAALRGDQIYAERFVQEARAVSQWRHENILQVHYAGQEGDVYFFAMEYIDGLNLEQILSQYREKGELMPHDDVIRIGRAIASALDYAHSRHVIHRDVKPSNVMVDKESRVVLADFGLAMNVQRGSVGQTFGTPHYVAPEQALNSADAVPQSDLYSLGVILYEMLTGQVPFDDPSSMSVALKHITEPPPAPRSINPHLSEQVEAVLLQALMKDPKKRYASGSALMDALEAAMRAQRESSQDLLALPPLPAGADGAPARPVSRLSLMDSVRLSAPMEPPRLGSELPEMEGWPTPAGVTAVPRPTTKRTASRKSPRQLLSLGGVGALVFLILALGAFLLMQEGDGGGAEAQGSEGAEEVAVTAGYEATAASPEATAIDVAVVPAITLPVVVTTEGADASASMPVGPDTPTPPNTLLP
ncbi:MAG TPA: serine/threonine-protein kinase, partial [Anaerolineae bacterium]